MFDSNTIITTKRNQEFFVHERTLQKHMLNFNLFIHNMYIRIVAYDNHK